MSKLQFTLPFLRFKEFINTINNYKIDFLFNLCSLVKSGGTPTSTNKDYYSGNIPFCSISDFKNNYLISTKKHITPQAIKSSSSFIFPKNNLLLSIYASIGEVAINLIDVAIPQSILGLMVSKIHLYYLFYLLQTHEMKKNFHNYSEQGTQSNLSQKTLKNLKICFTSNYSEQIKIGKFLLLLDKHIELWERKLQLYLLFFNYYHKYFFNLKITEMDCKINDYYCIPLKKAIDKNKYINYKKMILKLNNQGYELTNDSPIATEKGRSYFVREKNELLIGKQNIHNSSFYVLGDIGDKFVTSNALMSLISKEDISTKYLYYFMKQKRWLYYVDSLNLSTGQKEYSEKQILNLPFKIINSHKKIVNFLEHIEKEISFIKTKISFLKNKKEFFLNNLFV